MDYSNYHEESTNSSEEVVDQENKVDLGVGRSYECVFCKRGFNTAQALGGHMNIHRKDRARNKPNNPTTKQEEEEEEPQRLNQLGVRRFSPHHHQPHHLAYATYFPATTSSNSTLYKSGRGRQQPSDPVTDGDWRMRLSLEFEDLDKNTRVMDQDKELDLELRLGYDS